MTKLDAYGNVVPDNGTGTNYVPTYGPTAARPNPIAGLASATNTNPADALAAATAALTGGTSKQGSPQAVIAAANQRWAQLPPDQKAQLWALYGSTMGLSVQLDPQSTSTPPPAWNGDKLNQMIDLVAPYTAYDPTVNNGQPPYDPSNPAANPQYGQPGEPGFMGQGNPFVPPTSHQADNASIQIALSTNTKAAPYMDAVVYYAGQQGIPWQVLFGVINATSGFDPNYSNGAVHGLAAINPIFEGAQANANDPNSSIQFAAQQLADHFQRYNDWGLALIAYHLGPAAADYIKQNGRPAAGTDTEASSFINKAQRNFDKMGIDISQPEWATTSGVLKAGPDKVNLPDQTSLKQLVTQKFQQTFFRQPSDQEISNFVDIVNTAVTQSQLTGNNPYSAAGGQQANDATNVLSFANTLIGTPYRWGGTDPKGGIDCSGMVQYVFQHFGLDPGRDTGAQFNNRQGQQISDLNQALPGDLVFFGWDGNRPDHVGIYLGNGQMIDSPHTGATVGIHSIAGYGNITGIRRFPVGSGVAGLPPGAVVNPQRGSGDQGAVLQQAFEGTAAYHQLYGNKQPSQTPAAYAQDFMGAGKVGMHEASDQAVQLGMESGNPLTTTEIGRAEALAAGDPAAVGDLSKVAIELGKII